MTKRKYLGGCEHLGNPIGLGAATMSPHSRRHGLSVLFTGPMYRWTMGASFVRAAKVAGIAGSVVREEDYLPNVSSSSVVVRGTAAIVRRGGMVAYNLAVRRAVRRDNPAVVVVIKGDWLWPETASWISARVPTVVVSLDDFFPIADNECSRRVRACVATYAGVFTSKQHNVAELQAGNARRVRYLPPGVDPLVHPRCWRGFGSAIWDGCFIGTFERERAAMLSELRARSGPDVVVRGNGWPRRGPLALQAGGAVYESDKAFILAHSKVALSFLRKNHRDVLTDRPFEIAATGVPMIAERSSAQAEMFPENIAALYFGGPDELLCRLNELLSDRQRAEQLAHAAYERVPSHTYERRFETILRQVQDWGLV